MKEEQWGKCLHYLRKKLDGSSVRNFSAWSEIKPKEKIVLEDLMVYLNDIFYSRKTDGACKLSVVDILESRGQVTFKLTLPDSGVLTTNVKGFQIFLALGGKPDMVYYNGVRKQGDDLIRLLNKFLRK